jgi:hypothetical protein
LTGALRPPCAAVENGPTHLTGEPEEATRRLRGLTKARGERWCHAGTTAGFSGAPIALKALAGALSSIVHKRTPGKPVQPARQGQRLIERR